VGELDVFKIIDNNNNMKKRNIILNTLFKNLIVNEIEAEYE
jgi:hypothetical protein